MKAPKHTARVVYLDIETAPLEVYSWGLWDVNVAINQIKTEPTLMSAAWMFEGDRSVSYVDNRDAANTRDDRSVITALHAVLDEADVVVTQNGVKFDVRRINARFVMLGFPPPSSFRHVDTKIVAKQVFAFTSNRLEWMAEHVAGSVKLKHKDFPGFELWLEALKGNIKAWNAMRKYNMQDVRATRALYLKMRPWMKNHPNMGQFVDEELQVCPKCASDQLQARGFAYTSAGKYQRYQCQACAGWSRATGNLLSKKHRKNLVRGD